MGYLEDIEAYRPVNEQEAVDQHTMVAFARQNPHNVLLRENTIAHLTASGFVLNRQRTHALMVHHNILGIWAWTGGHADGDGDLLGVALREAREETGLEVVEPIDAHIAALDILWVPAHIKNGRYVGCHLHLSAAFLLQADDTRPLRPCEGENTDVRWFALEEFAGGQQGAAGGYFNEAEARLYRKLIDAAAARGTR